MIDTNTVEGVRLKKLLEERLTILRRQNEDTALDLTATAVLRGRIAEIKAMLAPPTPVTKPVPSYGHTRREA